MLFSCAEDPASTGGSFNGDFSMLEGTWEDISEKQTFIEYWNPADNGALEGNGFVLFENDTVLIEHLRIEKNGMGWVYYAGVSGHSGNQSVPFTLSEQSTANKLVFENLAHDFPQRIIYAKNGDNKIEVLIEGEENGNFRRRKLSYIRRTE